MFIRRELAEERYRMFISVYILCHCQMNENPCSNQEIHVLFGDGSELENTLNEPFIVCMTLYTESIADQIDPFADVLFAKTVRTLMTL